MSRFRNSVKNIAFGLGGQILNIIMSLIYRYVLNHTLSSVYLGVNGLFTNILMVFSLADLGVGTAIIYALYKPIAEGDTRKIQALMKMYQKAYVMIGFIIVGLGLVLTPFIEMLIKSDSALPPNIKLIFMMYVLNTASTYFFSYKGTLITANQKNYIVTNVVYSTSILCYGIQIVLLYLTHNFILTLSIQVATNTLQSIITLIIANRMYPYIRGKNDAVLLPEEKKGIYRNMGSLMFYRTGQVVINGTDSIIISSLVGIVENGFYSNYNLLTTTIRNLLQQVFTAVTASIGNLAVVDKSERRLEIYNTLYFANFWMFGFAAVCFFSLFQPFVSLAFGVDKLLGMTEIVFIVLNFYLIGMRNVNIVFRDTMGVFKEGRYVPIISAIVNIAVSIICAKLFGLVGAFMGTTISMLATLVWMEPVVLFNNGFKTSVAPYFKQYIKYFLVTTIATAATYFITTNVGTISLGGLIIKLLICLVVPNVIFFAFFGRTDEFRSIWTRGKSMLTNFKNRKKRAA